MTTNAGHSCWLQTPMPSALEHTAVCGRSVVQGRTSSISRVKGLGLSEVSGKGGRCVRSLSSRKGPD